MKRTTGGDAADGETSAIACWTTGVCGREVFCRENAGLLRGRLEEKMWKNQEVKELVKDLVCYTVT